jgi:hypothetical protein
MRLLDDSHWVAQVYGLVKHKSEMLNDLEVIKKALIRVISKSHLAHPGDIEEERKAAAAEFIRPYKIIFTTNYDLLLYWIAMFSGDPPPFQVPVPAGQAEFRQVTSGLRSDQCFSSSRVILRKEIARARISLLDILEAQRK